MWFWRVLCVLCFAAVASKKQTEILVQSRVLGASSQDRTLHRRLNLELCRPYFRLTCSNGPV